MGRDRFQEFLEKARSTPAFSCAQLLDIYEKSGRSTDLEKLVKTAKELYPDVLDTGAPIRIRDGGFKAFDKGDGYEKPKYTISSNRARCVGVMKNGNAYEY